MEKTARKALSLIREHAAQRYKQFGCEFSDWILDVCSDARTGDMRSLEARDETCDPDVAKAIGEALIGQARALRERNEALAELEAARAAYTALRRVSTGTWIEHLHTEEEPPCADCTAIVRYDAAVKARQE